MLENIDGEYREDGTWWDTNGRSGTLSGSVRIDLVENRLRFSYGDGMAQTTESLSAGARTAALHGLSSKGILLIGDGCLILEYTVSVNGREETNTDIWQWCEDVARRSGVIRQGERTIWFEAEMPRV